MTRITRFASSSRIATAYLYIYTFDYSNVVFFFYYPIYFRLISSRGDGEIRIRYQHQFSFHSVQNSVTGYFRKIRFFGQTVVSKTNAIAKGSKRKNLRVSLRRYYFFCREIKYSRYHWSTVVKFYGTETLKYSRGVKNKWKKVSTPFVLRCIISYRNKSNNIKNSIRLRSRM